MKQIEKHLEIIKGGVRSLTFDELLKADRLEIMKAILRTCDEISEEIGVTVCAKKNRDADASICNKQRATQIVSDCCEYSEWCVLVYGKYHSWLNGILDVLNYGNIRNTNFSFDKTRNVIRLINGSSIHFIKEIKPYQLHAMEFHDIVISDDESMKSHIMERKRPYRGCFNVVGFGSHKSLLALSKKLNDDIDNENK